MIYVDSNVLISSYLGDSNEIPASEFLATADGPLAIGSWVRTEFLGHVGLRLRKGMLGYAQHTRVLEDFDATIASFVQLPMTNPMFERAEAWLRDPACSLQPGDALHVSCALEHEVAAIATFDHRFAAGVARLKLKGLKLIVLPHGASGRAKNAPKAEQPRAAYKVTTRDIAAAAKWGRIRKNEERLASLKRR